jgi:hypothetical protein
MGWISKWLGFGSPPRELSESAKDVLWNRTPAAGLVQGAGRKNGEQHAAMTDPLGKRVYHEYFVGDGRGDGHYPWSCRIYCGANLAAEKTGLAASYLVARKQALDWAVATRKAISEAP